MAIAALRISCCKISPGLRAGNSSAAGSGADFGTVALLICPGPGKSSSYFLHGLSRRSAVLKPWSSVTLISTRICNVHSAGKFLRFGRKNPHPNEKYRLAVRPNPHREKDDSSSFHPSGDNFDGHCFPPHRS